MAEAMTEATVDGIRARSGCEARVLAVAKLSLTVYPGRIIGLKKAPI